MKKKIINTHTHTNSTNINFIIIQKLVDWQVFFFDYYFISLKTLKISTRGYWLWSSSSSSSMPLALQIHDDDDHHHQGRKKKKENSFTNVWHVYILYEYLCYKDKFTIWCGAVNSSSIIELREWEMFTISKKKTKTVHSRYIS